jgi:integrase/recombinase XerD
VRKFTGFLRENHLNASDDSLYQFKAHLLEDYAPASVNLWLSGVRSFFTWAHDNEFLLGDVPKIKGAKRKNANRAHKKDILTSAQVKALLGAPDTSSPVGVRDAAILYLFCFCALRTIEVHRMNLEDISMVSGVPVIRIQGKGSLEKDEQAVVTNPGAQKALFEWIALRGDNPGALFTSLSNRASGERLTTLSIRRMVKKYLRQIGIDNPRITTHSLRHTAGTVVARKDLLAAKTLLRHRNINTTLIYAHEADRLDNPPETLIDY